MKISTKGKYALEIAVDLALHSSMENPESLKNIADRRGLSEKYLERIIKAMKEEGIVFSQRGSKGGYCLTRKPEAVSVKEVLNAAEGELAPVECLTKETDCQIDCDKCPTKQIWNDMWGELISVVDGITIADIISKIDIEEK